MQRNANYSSGDRSEVFAENILSAFAATVRVQRQADFGDDFHCSLLKREGANLRPYLPFNVQIKSSGKSAKTIWFGRPKKKGKPWPEHEIKKLCQTDSPFLIGVADKRNQWLDLYSTVNRYFVYHNWFSRLPREVCLIPGKPGESEDVDGGTLEELPAENNLPTWRWHLRLGPPIVRITAAEVESEIRQEEIKSLLEPYLFMEQDNAAAARTGIGYFTWPVKIQTGQPVGVFGSGYYSTLPTPPKLDQTLKRAIGNLLHSYHDGGKKYTDWPKRWKALIQAWAAPLAQLSDSHERLVLQVIENAMRFAKGIPD